ncbi:MAG TPA: hypothetical protein VN700_03850 [Vicinamibacterales bacterium]|nr:hypothetical protein [Vicinamibacterales bacterium]
MKSARTWPAVAIAVCLFGVSLLAHQVTYKGTVISAAPTAIKVMVVNEKTKKPESMAFDLDNETKILRGDKLVKFADARIQKDEKIAVTIDHDADETLAIVVRLDVKK